MEKLFYVRSLHEASDGEAFERWWLIICRPEPPVPPSKVIKNYDELDSNDQSRARIWLSRLFTEDEARSLRDYLTKFLRLHCWIQEIPLPTQWTFRDTEMEAERWRYVHSFSDEGFGLPLSCTYEEVPLNGDINHYRQVSDLLDNTKGRDRASLYDIAVQMTLEGWFVGKWEDQIKEAEAHEKLEEEFYKLNQEANLYAEFVRSLIEGGYASESLAALLNKVEIFKPEVSQVSTESNRISDLPF